MALAGTIGTGLFLGPGRALANAGPAGIFMGYTIMIDRRTERNVPSAEVSFGSLPVSWIQNIPLHKDGMSLISTSFRFRRKYPQLRRSYSSG